MNCKTAATRRYAATSLFRGTIAIHCVRNKVAACATGTSPRAFWPRLDSTAEIHAEHKRVPHNLSQCLKHVNNPGQTYPPALAYLASCFADVCERVKDPADRWLLCYLSKAR